jgi:hypothetical protein
LGILSRDPVDIPRNQDYAHFEGIIESMPVPGNSPDLLAEDRPPEQGCPNRLQICDERGRNRRCNRPVMAWLLLAIVGVICSALPTASRS